MIESNGFDTYDLLYNSDRILFQNLNAPRRKQIPNIHLTILEKELYKAIKYEDQKRIRDLGASNQVNLNIEIEIEPKVFFPPLIFATVIGYAPTIKALLENPGLDINVVDKYNKCNAFWYAALYGRQQCLILLAEAGIDIM